MQYEKILMVWVVSHEAESRVWYEPKPLILFVLHENKQGVTNLSLSKHEFYNKSFENARENGWKIAFFYIFHNVEVNFSFEDIQAWLTTMCVISIGIP